MGSLNTFFRLTKYLVFILLIPANETRAQIILNPSFEGPPLRNRPPDHWVGCHEFGTPDTQPGFWEVSKPAADGYTYLGLVTRGNLGPYASQNEDIQTALTDPLRLGDVLTFYVDLSFSEKWGHTVGFGSEFLAYNTPAKLKVFGGVYSCEKTELLWESDDISHTDWRTYLVTLSPKEIDVNYLIFQADFTTASSEFGNILIDNIKECFFEIEWMPEVTICENEPLVLDVTIPNGTYEWQDGRTSPVYTIRQAGNYHVMISDGCATERFEIAVSTRNCFCDAAIPIQTVSYDSIKCEHDEIILDAGTPGGSYLWNTGSNEAVIDVLHAGLYTVEVSNNCESLIFNFLVETIECDCAISAPNVFTPNGDGINETFEITGTSDIIRYRLMVVDRSGKKVFETNQPGDHWDGTLNGKKLSAGVYYYTIDIGCLPMSSRQDHSLSGWVTIMR